MDSSRSSNRRDGQLAEGYIERLKILEQKVASRGHLLNIQNVDNIDSKSDYSKGVQGQSVEKTTTPN